MPVRRTRGTYFDYSQCVSHNVGCDSLNVLIAVVKQILAIGTENNRAARNYVEGCLGTRGWSFPLVVCKCPDTYPFMQDPPEGFVQNYCLLIGDKSFSNFQKVGVFTCNHETVALILDPSNRFST
jgi:hypothetical protein